MKPASVFGLSLILFSGSAHSAEHGFKKAYFGATKPGTFAKIRSVDDKGAVSEFTYARLADQNGDRWVETGYAVTSGQFKGTSSVMSYLVSSSFPFDKDGIDFIRGAKRCVAQVGGNEPTEEQPDMVKALATNGFDYAAIVSFKGTETVAGKECDHYTFFHKTNYPNAPVTIMTGDLWMSDQVPFGTVKEITITKDADGKVTGKYTNTLVESGSNAKTALRGWSWSTLAPGATPAPVAMSLAEAFRKELVSIECAVVDGSGGKRLLITITNKGDAHLRVSLTKTPMTFTVGAPLETLTIAAEADRKLDIPSEERAEPIEVTQTGKRRATSGTFTITRYEGAPLFQGSVEVGSAKN